MEPSRRAFRRSGVDREGVPREFPLTRLTAAIIHVDPDAMGSLFELSEMVADAKRESKRRGGDGIAEMRFTSVGKDRTSRPD